MPFQPSSRSPRDAIVRALVDAMGEVGLRVEAAAKAELYPGHGKLTGTLQRAIQAEGAREERSRIVTRVAVRGVPYAIKIHQRYRYLSEGMDKVRPRVMDILRQHVERRRG